MGDFIAIFFICLIFVFLSAFSLGNIVVLLFVITFILAVAVTYFYKQAVRLEGVERQLDELLSRTEDKENKEDE